MLRRGAFVRSGLRWGALSLIAFTTLTAFSTNDADARSRRRAHHRAAAAHSSYEPPYSSIVVDANSGQVMQSTNADAIRHPASLTKIMTLYLLFERLDQGKTKLSSEIPISAHAASQAPSKLGLKPGDSIRVENAIRAIVTRSANDIAVAVGEYLGGDEPSFGRMMTAKARVLGMTNTTYRNASGLPNDEQVTTARDQALLGRAIQDRYPEYYKYFSTRNFDFRGNTIRSHNHLLGRIEGVDGIKTGYIRASGFNIVTSARRAGRHVIAVVFGGSTARARDARVVGLIENNINVASVKRTAPVIAEAADRAREIKEAKVEAKRDTPMPTPAPQREPVREQVASAAPVAEPLATPTKELPREQLAAVAAAALEPPSVGSTDPIKPNSVKTVTVHSANMRTASLSPMPSDSRKLAPTPAGTTASVTTVNTVKGDVPPPPPGARPGILGVLPVSGAKVASAGGDVPMPAAAASEASAKARPVGGWMIQVGAFDDEKDAKQRLDTCQSKVKDVLAKADPFTEKVSKGEKALYRARFAGLDKDQAERACKQLKHGDIPCMLLKN
ncbi:D-alanyl-D-alanine carboxypeptidase [Microbacteriaceae bacterium K1510]|nr:D-alanyl-D-alanine carboxypeptidase [Microbacteriaceae bacterium K1510]